MMSITAVILNIISWILLYSIMKKYGLALGIETAKTVALVYIVYELLTQLNALTSATTGQSLNLFIIALMIVLIIYAYKLQKETHEKIDFIMRKWKVALTGEESIYEGTLL